MGKKSATIIHIALPAYNGSDALFLDQIPVASKLNNVYRVQQPLCYADTMLFNLLVAKPEEKPPYAAIAGLGNDLEVGHHAWVRADPIELMVDAGNICMIGRDHLLLEKQEAQDLLKTLNALIKEDGIELREGTPHEWYIRLPTTALDNDLVTQPLGDVISRDIRAFLPMGDNHPWWHKLLTELQMLLFDHVVNRERQMQGRPLINSVWLWGEGRLTKHYALKPYSGIITDSALVRGINRLSKQNIPFLECCQQSLHAPHFDGPGEYLITINHYLQGWESIAALFTFLFQEIEQRRCQQLKVYLGNGSIFSWKNSRWRFL